MEYITQYIEGLVAIFTVERGLMLFGIFILCRIGKDTEDIRLALLEIKYDIDTKNN